MWDYVLKSRTQTAMLHNQFSCSVMSNSIWHHASLSITNSQSLLKLIVHKVSDAIQSSHPLSSPSPPAFNLSQHQGPMSQFFISGGPSIGVSASASILPMNIQDWFPLGLTGLISLQSKGLLRVFSNTTVQSINSSTLSLLHGPTLTFIHDYWKNHSFDYTNLCWQSNISAF